jgi:hypothetical protein
MTKVRKAWNGGSKEAAMEEARQREEAWRGTGWTPASDRCADCPSRYLNGGCNNPSCPAG